MVVFLTTAKEREGGFWGWREGARRGFVGVKRRGVESPRGGRGEGGGVVCGLKEEGFAAQEQVPARFVYSNAVLSNHMRSCNKVSPQSALFNVRETHSCRLY